MHDPWTEKLSDYIDGGLSRRDERLLEEHLLTCDECTTTVRELRDVVGAAAALQPAEPPRDLWAGIAAGISAAPAVPERVPDVVPIRSSRRARTAFTFSVPQLAAAAVLLVALGAGGMWLLAGTQDGQTPAAVADGGAVDGTILFASWGEEPTTRSAGPATPASFRADVAQLEGLLDKMRDQLAPSTVEAIEHSLASIDDAISSAQAALAADPENPYLVRQLEGAMQKKLDVLRRANRVGRGAT